MPTRTPLPTATADAGPLEPALPTVTPTRTPVPPKPGNTPTPAPKDDTTITIVLSAQPPALQTIRFWGSLDEFWLANLPGGEDVIPARRTFVVTPGRYAVSQAVASQWTLLTITCTGDGWATGDVEMRKAVLVVGAGDDAVCTFTNVR
jgi:hypothetical protein